jgi:hypothetical protein
VTDYYAQMHGQFAGGIPWSTGLHITSNQSESALATTWSNAIQNLWTDGANGIETLYPLTTSLTQVTVATLNATMHEVTKTRIPKSIPGTSTADTLPYQEAVVISWRGNSVQRRGRGRMYLPALAEDQVNNDAVITAAGNRLKAAFTALASAIQADGSTIFVFPKKPTKDGTPAFTKTVVTTPLVALKPARMSRRVRKVAPEYL